MPPLRERREDIPQLVQHFARLTSEEHNLKPKKFEAAAMDALQRYRWRGNIRELRNTVERVMIMSPAEVVRHDDLPGEIRSGNRASRRACARHARGARGCSCGRAREQHPAGRHAARVQGRRRTHALVQKLRENNWNISKTAEVIDTPRSNLYKKLEQCRIKKREVDR